MNAINVKRSRLNAWVAVGITVLVGFLGLIDVRLSLLLVITLIVAFILCLKPPYALAALIFLAPFSGTALIGDKFAGIPGLKIINLVIFAVVILFILSKRSFKGQKQELFFVLGSISLLAISVLRSMPHLHTLNAYFGLSMGSGKYLISYLVKPAFFMLPFLIIAGYMRKQEDVEFIIKCFKYAMLFLSGFILVFYLFQIGNKSSWTHVRDGFSAFFGMHTNGLANFYILGYPIVLAWFLYKKNMLNTVNLVFALASVAVLYSRTAYILIVISTILFLVLQKKKKLLPVVLFLGICAVFIAPDTVVERGLTGIDKEDLQTISAGRVGGIWLPLLDEIKDNPTMLLVGSGRYAIIHSSPLWKGHAHNMYLTTLLDVGIVGLSFFIFFFIYFLKEITKGIKSVPEGKYRTLLVGTLVSTIAYLISGLTGRDLFPAANNSYLWLLLAIAFNIIRLHRQERKVCYEL